MDKYENKSLNTYCVKFEIFKQKLFSQKLWIMEG